MSHTYVGVENVLQHNIFNSNRKNSLRASDISVNKMGVDLYEWMSLNGASTQWAIDFLRKSVAVGREKASNNLFFCQPNFVFDDVRISQTSE